MILLLYSSSKTSLGIEWWRCRHWPTALPSRWHGEAERNQQDVECPKDNLQEPFQFHFSFDLISATTTLLDYCDDDSITDIH